jgi:hypothetical protein
MTDIVERLRGLRFVHVPVASGLMEESAAEIERLRTLATHATPREGSVQSRCTLTDEEREAVEAAARIIDLYDDEMDGFSSGAAATLRGLLERLGGER